MKRRGGKNILNANEEETDKAEKSLHREETERVEKKKKSGIKSVKLRRNRRGIF